MSKHDPTAALRHMLDHAKEAVLLAEGKTRADLDTDRLLNLALVRLLEIVGEAAGRVPEAVRAPPGDSLAADRSLRNRLIHGYDSVDFNILWQIITSDLAPLIAALEAIIASEDAE